MFPGGVGGGGNVAVEVVVRKFPNRVETTQDFRFHSFGARCSGVAVVFFPCAETVSLPRSSGLEGVEGALSFGGRGSSPHPVRAAQRSACS